MRKLNFPEREMKQNPKNDLVKQAVEKTPLVFISHSQRSVEKGLTFKSLLLIMK